MHLDIKISISSILYAFTYSNKLYYTSHSKLEIQLEAKYNCLTFVNSYKPTTWALNNTLYSFFLAYYFFLLQI